MGGRFFSVALLVSMLLAASFGQEAVDEVPQLAIEELEDAAVPTDAVDSSTELYGYGYGRFGRPRFAVDGHRCGHSWVGRRFGRRLSCRTYCCYVRGHRRAGSFCRVFEYGRQVLRRCRRS